jgi:hypothetical protein
MEFSHSKYLGDEPWVPIVIGIQEGNDLTTCESQSSVAGRRGPTIGLLDEPNSLIVKHSNKGRSLVSRPVVNNQDLGHSGDLTKNRLHGPHH